MAIELIGPERAGKMLADMHPSRAPDRFIIKTFAAQMRAGTWVPALNPVRTAKADGRLLSGQHVLHAIIEYGQETEIFTAEVDAVAVKTIAGQRPC